MSFGEWLNPDVREKDVKLLMFGAVAVFGILKLGIAPITDQWVNAFYGLCALVGLGGSAMAAVEKWKGGKITSDPAPSTKIIGNVDTLNQEGPKP